MPSTDRFARRRHRAAHARHEPVERGIPALLRVDLHAMIRLLTGQQLTVADILGSQDRTVSGHRAR